MQLPENADIEHTAELAASLPAALAAGSGTFTLDASACKSIDTSTIALLLQARRLAQAAGREFAVSGAPAKLAALASLYGVAELLSLPSSGPSGELRPATGA